MRTTIFSTIPNALPECSGRSQEGTAGDVAAFVVDQ
jgi:hypothetical protein